MDWHALRIPFNVADVDFRPGATTKDKTKAIGLAYVDKRIYEDRLDDLIGPGNWSVEYRQLGDKGIICRLIIDNVVREDVGEFATDDVASFPMQLHKHLNVHVLHLDLVVTCIHFHKCGLNMMLTVVDLPRMAWDNFVHHLTVITNNLTNQLKPRRQP